MPNKYTTDLALIELVDKLPGEFCRVLTIDEFWPEGLGKGPAGPAHEVQIHIGFLSTLQGAEPQKFDGRTLDEAMNKVWPYYSETCLCAQCGYPVDNAGLCVMDAAHRGYRSQC